MEQAYCIAVSEANLYLRIVLVRSFYELTARSIPTLAKRESKCLHAWVEKFNLESPVLDGPWMS